jgi:hypothetical protein
MLFRRSRYKRHEEVGRQVTRVLDLNKRKRTLLRYFYAFD